MGISLGMFTCGYMAAWELWKTPLHWGIKQQLLVSHWETIPKRIIQKKTTNSILLEEKWGLFCKNLYQICHQINSNEDDKWAKKPPSVFQNQNEIRLEERRQGGIYRQTNMARRSNASGPSRVTTHKSPGATCTVPDSRPLAIGRLQTRTPPDRKEQHISQCQPDCADLRGAVPWPKNPSQTGGFGITLVSGFLNLRGSRCGLTRCWRRRGTVCLAHLSPGLLHRLRKIGALAHAHQVPRPISVSVRQELSSLLEKLPCSHIKMQRQQQHRQNKAGLPQTSLFHIASQF